MAKTVVGLFNNALEARSTVHELVRCGVHYADIGVMAPMRDAASADLVADELQGSAGGREVGLVVLLPGLGLMIAAGPIIETLRARRIHEGVLDTLTELGVPEEQVFFYADGMRRGGTLLSVVTARSMLDRVARVVSVHRVESAAEEARDTLVDLFIDQDALRRS